MGTGKHKQQIAQIGRVAAGDTEALELLYKEFAGTVNALIVRILGSRTEAEELLQDVFLEIWQRAGSYDSDRGSPAAWIVTIARSRAIDALRRRKRKGEAGRSLQCHQQWLAELERHGDSPGRAYDHGAVRRALAQLTADQQELLALSYFGGMSHSEIAAHLSLPLGTVKSRILAAMKSLRRSLEAPTRAATSAEAETARKRDAEPSVLSSQTWAPLPIAG